MLFHFVTQEYRYFLRGNCGASNLRISRGQARSRSRSEISRTWRVDGGPPATGQTVQSSGSNNNTNCFDFYSPASVLSSPELFFVLSLAIYQDLYDFTASQDSAKDEGHNNGMQKSNGIASVQVITKQLVFSCSIPISMSIDLRSYEQYHIIC